VGGDDGQWLLVVLPFAQRSSGVVALILSPNLQNLQLLQFLIDVDFAEVYTCKY
jgi:hypothetical protein